MGPVHDPRRPNADALAMLRRQIGEHGERVFTFRGRPVRKANTSVWDKALERVGIVDFRGHDLRHTWAPYHVQRGTPMHAFQELGGWSNTEMVRRYAHLSVEHLAECAERLAGSRTKSGTVEDAGELAEAGGLGN